MTAFSFNVENLPVDDIFVVGNRRPVDEGAVSALVESINRLGLRTPITVRVDENITDPESGELLTAFALVAGRHRLEAYRALGETHIPAIVRECDEVEAELWEISENLHRADLTKAQRDEQIRRYAELLKRVSDLQSTQNAPIESKRADGRGHRPAGIARQIADETGLSKSTVQRALANPEQRAASNRSKIDADVKARAAKEVAEMIAEHVPGDWWDALKSNLYAAGASNIANELNNITGQSIMDRRYGQ